MENRSEIGHANKLHKKSDNSGTWLEKSPKKGGGNGSVRAPETHIFRPRGFPAPFWSQAAFGRPIK